MSLHRQHSGMWKSILWKENDSKDIIEAVLNMSLYLSQEFLEQGLQTFALYSDKYFGSKKMH